uniref:Uncharacterized protein n=1 Tax=Odontella aurita TaxID=265563 RepID=A0A7S4IGP9_9STRA|mmetsp:Transcript_24816/g.72702  ORF Transcript_24816/g.72702 Transcript_24816/m.72702 type:complete len:495 (+) Transcript_24816:277-1761(+)
MLLLLFFDNIDTKYGYFVRIVLFAPSPMAPCPQRRFPLCSNETGRTQSFSAASTLRLERCRTSCEDVILNSGGSPSESIFSSSALASYTVDALFLIRDADASGVQEEQRSNRKSRRNKEDREQDARNGSRRINGDDFWEKVVPPPTRLPSLIETLVGSVDGRYPFRGYGEGAQNKGIIAQGDALHKSGVTASSAGRKAHDGAKSPNESVEMAAAAAAAAFWSQTSGRGRYRMSIVNEEWERSLRWIAGWEQSPEAVDHRKFSQSKHEIHKEESGSVDYLSRGDVDLDDARLSFLDACIDECVGNKASDRKQDRSSLGQWSRNGSQLVISFISIFTGKSTGQWAFGFSTELRYLIFGIFRIALSSAVLIGFRSTCQWLDLLWSSRRRESSAWFLDEDTLTVDARRSSRRARKNANKKKASLSRRSRRRNQSLRAQRWVPNKAEGVEVDSPPGDIQDEDEVDFESLKRLILPGDKVFILNITAAEPIIAGAAMGAQ